MPNRGAFVYRVVCSTVFALLFSAASVSADCMPAPPGAVGWWPGDGSAEDLVADRDGLLLGEIEFGEGTVRQAFLFDGQHAGVEIPNTDGAFDLVGMWTIEAWVYPFEEGNDARRDPIVWKIAAPDSHEDTFALGWGCHSCAGRDRFQISIERESDGQDFVVVSGEHAPQEWHYVAAVYDGTSLIIYVNGVEEGRALIGKVTAYTGPAPLRIGNILHSTHASAGVFDGKIDEVEIYDRILAPNEINRVFRSGRIGKCRPTLSSSDSLTGLFSSTHRSSR